MSLKNRTKNLFADALYELSKTKSLTSITVIDLVNYCGVNRYTFYYHFKDKYDLLWYCVCYQVQKQLEQVPDDGEISNAEQVKKLLIYVKEYKRFFKDAFSDTSPYSLLALGTKFWINFFRTIVKKALDVTELDIKVDCSICVFCYGIIGLFVDWVQNDCIRDIEELTQYIFYCGQMHLVQGIERDTFKKEFQSYIESVYEK